MYGPDAAAAMENSSVPMAGVSLTDTLGKEISLSVGPSKMKSVGQVKDGSASKASVD